MTLMSNRVLTCAFSLGLVASMSAPALAQVSSTTTQQIGAIQYTTQTAPAVSGTVLVWTTLSGTNLDIYSQDISTGAPPVNLTNSANDGEQAPDISGTSIVWTHTGGASKSSGDVILYNSSTGKTQNIAAASSAVHFAHPAINGNYIVFERITGQYDIDIYDQSIGAAPGPQITRDAAVQMHPRVSGDVVVYEDYNSNANVPAAYGYHVSTSGPPFLIAAAPAATPDIDGNNVVYVGADSAGNNQIMLYNLATLVTTTLTTAASHKTTPRISGNRIVWSDDRNGEGSDVYVYDLSTNSETLLAFGPNDESAPDVDGGRIVYTGTDGNGNPYVYLYTYPGTTVNSAPVTTPVTILPIGCDPSLTDLADGPMVLTETGTATISASRSFKSVASKTYYMCVVNGLSDGTERSSHVMGTVDGSIVLTPTNLGAAASPVAYAAVTVLVTSSVAATTNHSWAGAVYQQANTTASISIRVAK
jgi:beta propeller repeat protein